MVKLALRIAIEALKMLKDAVPSMVVSLFTRKKREKEKPLLAWQQSRDIDQPMDEDFAIRADSAYDIGTTYLVTEEHGTGIVTLFIMGADGGVIGMRTGAECDTIEKAVNCAQEMEDAMSGREAPAKS